MVEYFSRYISVLIVIIIILSIDTVITGNVVKEEELTSSLLKFSFSLVVKHLKIILKYRVMILLEPPVAIIRYPPLTTAFGGGLRT